MSSVLFFALYALMILNPSGPLLSARDISPTIDRLSHMVEETYRPAPFHPQIKAVYLVQGEGELRKEELRRHAEVLVTDSFEEVKDYAKWRVAIWVDKNALGPLLDKATSHWFKASPQVFYPMVLLGYGDPVSAFKILIPVNCSPKSPCVSYQDGEVYPGFSVFLKVPNAEVPDIIEGYREEPQVSELLDITNALLTDDTSLPIAP